MEDREDHDLFAVDHEEHRVRESLHERAPDPTMHLRVSRRERLHAGQGGVDGRDLPFAETFALGLVPPTCALDVLADSRT